MRYIIQPGDTLFTLARRYGTTVDAIVAANPEILDPNVIFVGQIITIPTMAPAPPGRRQYVVQPGDTMFLIARRLGVSLDAIVAANPQIADPSVIFPGQVINIP